MGWGSFCGRNCTDLGLSLGLWLISRVISLSISKKEKKTRIISCQFPYLKNGVVILHLCVCVTEGAERELVETRQIRISSMLLDI